MRLEYFPACCTFKIVTHLGGTRNADHVMELEPTANEIIKYINEAMKLLKKNGQAALIITTNNEQVKVNRILKDLKFDHTPWFSKEMHENTKVRLWWKAIN